MRELSPELEITAEFSPPRDEGLAYVQKLHDHVIETELLHFDNMIHAFLNMEDLVPDACKNRLPQDCNFSKYRAVAIL